MSPRSQNHSFSGCFSNRNTFIEILILAWKGKKGKGKKKVKLLGLILVFFIRLSNLLPCPDCTTDRASFLNSPLLILELEANISILFKFQFISEIQGPHTWTNCSLHLEPYLDRFIQLNPWSPLLLLKHNWFFCSSPRLSIFVCVCD